MSANRVSFGEATGRSSGATLYNNSSFVAGVRVRVLSRETHHLSAQVTQNPLENGDTISEHMSRTPNYVDIAFEMTNTTDNGEPGPSRAITVAQEFIRMMNERQIVTLETEHLIYRNMVVVSFTPDHRAPYKGAYAATIRLQEVGIIGQSQTVSSGGGRPREILADDGTKYTAVNLINAGQVEMEKDTPEVIKLSETLKLRSSAIYGRNIFAN